MINQSVFCSKKEKKYFKKAMPIVNKAKTFPEMPWL
jgi:hypothetical protein